jgi:hypothetical protein
MPTRTFFSAIIFLYNLTRYLKCVTRVLMVHAYLWVSFMLNWDKPHAIVSLPANGVLVLATPQSAVCSLRGTRTHFECKIHLKN